MEEVLQQLFLKQVTVESPKLNNPQNLIMDLLGLKGALQTGIFFHYREVIVSFNQCPLLEVPLHKYCRLPRQVAVNN